MNELERQLYQKIGDTTVHEERIKKRLHEKMHKKRQKKMYWLVPVVVITLLIISLRLQATPPFKSADSPAVIEQSFITHAQTGEQLAISTELHDLLIRFLAEGKEAPLRYTPSDYIQDGYYVTADCKETFCGMSFIVTSGDADYLSSFEKGRLLEEQLSPDKKNVMAIIENEDGKRLNFINNTKNEQHYQTNKQVKNLRTAAWISPTKIRLYFNDKRTKVIELPKGGVSK